ARLLLSYAAEVPESALPARVDGPLPVAERPLDEDALAFRRDDRQFRNVLLVELPHDDFAHVVVRLFLLAAYQRPLYDALAGAADARLAAIADKARKEVAYHLDHAGTWLRRLGDGTEESHRRAQEAVDACWPYTGELFTPLAGPVDPATLRGPWEATVAPALAAATLTRPADGWAPSGGRQGMHTEHLGYLLAEMQSLHRAHPGARW
ncbi:MAG TPA: 1,2-phenylacetyl-CoA epoxidase subunit PaaC, partial [Pilimelia sp.]|nr:1,2-phenylacetyl-CoA epoxidase subunit PaaC [Pilimelia sp.]